jgi:hypothetical protein
MRFSRDKRLHRLDAGQPLVHVHGVQQRLVKTGLVLLGHQQHLVLRPPERSGSSLL